MTSPLRLCPQCRAKLDSPRAPQKGVTRCPECGARLSTREKDSDDGLQLAPSAHRPAAKSGRSSRNEDRDTLVRKKDSSSLVVLLVVGGVLAFLFLLVLIGGGLAFYLYAVNNSGPMPPMAKTVPDAPLQEHAPVAPPAPAPVNPPAVQPPQPPEPAVPPKDPIQPVQQGERGALPLKELKAASVYIKAMTATMGATGSGFVLRAQGDTVYIVTNHHVVVPPKENAGRPPMVPLPPIGPRRPVRPPIGPRRPRRGIAAFLPPGQQAAELTVVFYSGTAKEQSLRAEIVGLDAGADLAVLKVVGVHDAPRPIDGSQTPELVETMPVLAFGFPFGEKLDPGKRNPAVTVTKGAVSSLRGNRGELEEVQLDLDLNPGNSGGPVVDEKGALIGVAVAKVNNTRIGFAVPVPKLNRLLQGRIDPPARIEALTIQGRTQVRILAPAADPLGKLRAPTLLYGPANELQMPQQGPQGWEKLAGAKSSELTIRGTEAAATLALTPPVNGELKVLAQVSYQTESGQTVYSEPRPLSLGSASAPPPSGGPNTPVKPPIVAARPSRLPKGEELTKLLADLKSADEATRQRAASTLQQAPPRERRDEVQRGLRELLVAADAATRIAGVQAMAACDPKEAAPALAKLLADEVPSVRHTVLRVMKDLKDPRVAEAVAARLPIEPLPAMDVLKAIGPAAEKALLPYLADKYAGQTRFWTFNILKEIGTADSLPALEAVQGTDKVHVRGVLEAVRQRVPLTAEEWPGALDDLKSADAAQRTKATRRIAATPPIEERRADVASRLEGLLNDQSGDVRIAAVKGLARWDGQKSVPLLAKRLEGFDPGFHAAIIEVLAELKGDEAAAAIAKRLPDVHDRGKATQALKAMDPLVAEKAILPLLSETNAFVRCEAIKVLTNVGGRDSIAPLEKLASDNNVFYSGLAKQALEAIKDRSEAK